MSQTLQQREEDLGANASGFDYMRLALAVAIVCWHSIAITMAGDHAIWSSPWRVLPTCLVPMFFALSGYLVTASLQRSGSAVRFFTYRILRIVPALAVEVALSALLLGAAFTTLPLTEYLRSAETWAYFLNIVGHIHYTLPGVFAHNPVPDMVNQPLWTVPYEFYCYVIVGGMLLMQLVRFRFVVLLLAAAFIIVSASNLDWYLNRYIDFFLPGISTVVAFLCGMVLSLYRDKVKYSALMAWCCLAVALPAFLQLYWVLWGIPFLAYFTVWLGLCNPPRVALLRSGDYSYGIYLFGFPIQQACMHLLPQYPYWWLNIGLALPVSFAYAVFSWHMIEKRVLAHRIAIASWVEARLRWFLRF